MNESEIAEKLKQNIPTTEPSIQPNPPRVPDEDEDRGFSNDIGDNINLYKLYDYFNVDPNYRTGESEQKLQVIYRWAADKAQSTDYLAVAEVLTNYSFGMGSGGLESNNLQRMYEFIQLDRQMEQLRREQGLLYQ